MVPSSSDDAFRPVLYQILKYGISAVSVYLVYLAMTTNSSLKKRIQRQLFACIFSKFSSPNLSRLLAPHKEELFASMRDIISADVTLATSGPGCIRILEIGIGNGTNLQYYPRGSRLVSVEPNPYFESYFKKSHAKFNEVTVEKFIEGSAEDMSLVESASCDAVVSTHVLCSVDDVAKCLSEINRVLTPGGKFYFVEHVSFPDEYEKSKTAQRWIEPIWRFVSDDCRISRDIGKNISEAGFAHVDTKNLILDGVYYVMRPHIIGVAAKDGEHF